MGKRIIVKTAPFFLLCTQAFSTRLYTKEGAKNHQICTQLLYSLIVKRVSENGLHLQKCFLLSLKNQEALPYLDKRQDKSHWNWQTDGAPYFLCLFVQCAAIGNQLFLYPLARIWKRFRLFDSLCPYALEWPTFSKDRTIRLSLINFLS